MATLSNLETSNRAISAPARRTTTILKTRTITRRITKTIKRKQTSTVPLSIPILYRNISFSMTLYLDLDQNGVYNPPTDQLVPNITVDVVYRPPTRQRASKPCTQQVNLFQTTTGNTGSVISGPKEVPVCPGNGFEINYLGSSILVFGVPNGNTVAGDFAVKEGVLPTVTTSQTRTASATATNTKQTTSASLSATATQTGTPTQSLTQTVTALTTIATFTTSTTLRCGDGILSSGEDCDDGNDSSGDGCSSTCQVEPGWICPTVGAPCIAKECGDGIVAGSEGCDDGNLIPFDGCSSSCQLESRCAGGACDKICGDGVKHPDEACDDGNKVDGDGCSSTCTVEAGWTCVPVMLGPAVGTLDVPILYRDMLYTGTTVPGTGHPDFEIAPSSSPCPATTGVVADILGADGKPAAGSNLLTCSSSSTAFCWWFHETDCSGVGTINPLSFLVYKDAADNPTVLSLAVTAVSASYSSLLFFPLDGLGWNAGAIPQPSKDCSGSVDRNFAFTSELHYTFTYDASSPAPTFQLTANDDYWVFVNRKLVIDKGGVKSSTSGSFTADSTFATLFDLVSGQSYSIDVFQAERATCSSNYEITFAGLQRLVSQCTKSG